MRLVFSYLYYELRFVTPFEGTLFLSLSPLTVNFISFITTRILSVLVKFFLSLSLFLSPELYIVIPTSIHNIFLEFRAKLLWMEMISRH